jgi:hypothetical protein
MKSLIHSRTKTEWQAFFAGYWRSIRIFVQENGEVSAVLGFVLGTAMVLLLKPFILVACLVGLAYLVIMVTARDET